MVIETLNDQKCPHCGRFWFSVSRDREANIFNTIFFDFLFILKGLFNRLSKVV